MTFTAGWAYFWAVLHTSGPFALGFVAALVVFDVIMSIVAVLIGVIIGLVKPL